MYNDHYTKYTRNTWCLPGGPLTENPISNAGDMGFIPGWGTKIPHASGQLSLSTAVREAHVPQLPSPHCPTTATTEPVCSRAHESESHTIVSDPLQPHGLHSPWNSPGQNTGVGSLFLLPNPGIEPRSPTLQADSLPAEPQEKAKNTGVGSLSLLQQIFPTQESNWGLQIGRAHV